MTDALTLAALVAILTAATYRIGWHKGYMAAHAEHIAHRLRHAGNVTTADPYAWPWPPEEIRAASDERARQAFRDHFPPQQQHKGKQP